MGVAAHHGHLVEAGVVAELREVAVDEANTIEIQLFPWIVDGLDSIELVAAVDVRIRSSSNSGATSWMRLIGRMQWFPKSWYFFVRGSHRLSVSQKRSLL